MNYTIKLKRKPKNELYHHGIHGQRWGVRNGPPYPLDSKTSARVKKGKQAKLRLTAKEYQKKRESLNKGKLKKDEVEGMTKMVSEHARTWQEVIDMADEERFGAKYINVADAINADNSFRYLHDESDQFMLARKVKDYEWMANHINVNVGFNKKFYNGQGNNGQTQNCAKCTAAMAMQFKGYDVSAGRSLTGAVCNANTYWFDGAVAYNEHSTQNAFDRIKKGGRNSYGEIAIRYPDGGGHSMFYYTDKDNIIHIKDGQTNHNYRLDSDDRNKSIDWIMDRYGADKNQPIRITRLDTATPNFDHMSEDSVLRINDGMFNDIGINDNMLMNKKTGKVVQYF